MSNESKFFTVKFVKTVTKDDGTMESTIEVDNYTKEQVNDAVIAFNNKSTYARSLKNCPYFRVSLLNEWDGVEKFDTVGATVVVPTENKGE